MNIAALRALLEGDLENALIANTPGGIEAQEAAGQRMLNATDILPKDGPWAELEQLGFTRLGDYDDLFYNVEMPAGWSRRPTEHSMWSDLVDEQGRKRGGIFYKAAFYDRRADMHLKLRYRADGQPEGGYTDDGAADSKKPYRGYVWDGDTVIWQTDTVVPAPADRRDDDEMRRYFAATDKLEKQARAWLAEHYPDWKNPLAYW